MRVLYWEEIEIFSVNIVILEMIDLRREEWIKVWDWFLLFNLWVLGFRSWFKV